MLLTNGAERINNGINCDSCCMNVSAVGPLCQTCLVVMAVKYFRSYETHMGCFHSKKRNVSAQQ